MVDYSVRLRLIDFWLRLCFIDFRLIFSFIDFILYYFLIMTLILIFMFTFLLFPFSSSPSSYSISTSYLPSALTNMNLVFFSLERFMPRICFINFYSEIDCPSLEEFYDSAPSGPLYLIFLFSSEKYRTYLQDDLPSCFTPPPLHHL